MGKKRWNMRAIQALLLLVTLCFILHAFAQSVSSAPQRTKKVAAKKKGSATAQTAQQGVAKTSAKKNKKDVKAGVGAKRSPGTKSRTTTTAKSVTPSSRRHGQRKTVAGSSFSSATAPFAVRLNNEWLPHRINSVFALPADKFILEVGEAGGKEEYLLQAAPEVTRLGLNQWSWQAPRRTGLYPVKILHPTKGATIVLNVFVMVPFSQIRKGALNGYRIGNYPRVPLKQAPTYRLPQGFIEVTKTNETVLVSPHFSLRQFLCKQESKYPKYLVLDARLLLVLESLVKKVNEAGYHCPTFEIMSGYRTPHYNSAIGNSTTYSRHLWGDAADIFIDVNPRDGEMDDLNRDGVANFQDTQVLYNIVNKMYEPRVSRFPTNGFMGGLRAQQLLLGGPTNASPLRQFLTGGVARYRETSAHGPFVHVDVRGVYTKWGQ